MCVWTVVFNCFNYLEFARGANKRFCQSICKKAVFAERRAAQGPQSLIPPELEATRRQKLQAIGNDAIQSARNRIKLSLI